MSEKSVYIMMSGGVDSSVASYEIVKQGYKAKGVFMKCWSLEALEKLGVSKDLYGCFWEDDALDAEIVAKKLGIDFEIWDLQDEYRSLVVDYMISEYKLGRTPNPDIMCNSMIKFGAFYKKAIAEGADFVATGHYARSIEGTIYRALDTQKDQSYFLCGIHKEALEHTLFPIGEYTEKSLVRQTAEKQDLITASKPDSQGLCFVGSTPLRELLIQTLGVKTGNIVDAEGKILGTHPGSYLYTIGQRGKLGLSGGPWYVSEIDIEKNTVTVANVTNLDSLLSNKVLAMGMNWQVDNLPESFKAEAQVRYRQLATSCTVRKTSETEVEVIFDESVKAVAVGQSIVIYQGDKMLGGGVVSGKK